ncbi:DoxX family membrane protein [Streptomonospora nanhaiensis]|uniref:Putative membrane protein YphA (DoxX/SURF4 family) n=1 Tax=Streptomonospora nanhaiensis TaxID=1323731 RepID=A0A853BQH6_9ACTN|nr:DoxX family membrane protein [Streptomonospora nanhaiensis]MBV2363426.1 DoxX family membrane protein [Streptomonospora nanhaiensis]MBX9387660.1 DoxX family membrane protein [Streptomonospora nanhaiensis]NYI96916.1 putative membrane protein YphA (DoxX/SURF4 family) [Streptomonospora nanhaiensis]
MGVLRIQLQRLLAAPFIVDSVETLRDPEPRAEALAPMVSRLSKRYPWVPDNPVLVVRAQAAAGIGAGTLLLFGKGTRLACVVMAAQAVPSIVAAAQGHTAPSAREGAIKDLGLLGALVLLATEPRRRPPKVVYDAQHAVRHARRSTARARRRAGRTVRKASTRLDPRPS